MKYLIVFCFIFFCFCSPSKNSIQVKVDRNEIPKKNPSTMISPDSQTEQISCNDSDCTTIQYDSYDELDKKIYEQMRKGAGKIFIQMRSYTLLLSDEPLASVVPYFREILDREGRVSIEPYYMGERNLERLSFSFLKDAGMVSWNIFSRLRDAYYYRHTKNYNAKILYHPKYHTIMMIFFIHKNFGDVCSTIYSNCMQIEYLDDESFDLSLSTALNEAKKNNSQVKVVFNQEKTKLVEAKLTRENFQALGKSARLYKWLILAKKTEKKPKKRERFMGADLVVTVLDYSLTLYDLYKQYQIYKPVMDLKAELTYLENSEGKVVDSIVFTPE
jgi:hypothetical protein